MDGLIWILLLIAAGSSLSAAVVYIVRLRRRLAGAREEILLLRTVIDSLPCPIFIKNVSDDFRYLLSNPAHASFLSRVPEQIVGRTDAEIFSEAEGEFVKRFRLDDEEAVRLDRNIESTEKVRLPSGRTCYLHGVKKIVHRPDGGKLLMGMATEVTELENTRQKAEKSRRLLEAILEHVPVGVFLKDPEDDYRYIIWNKALSELSGVPVESVIGKSDFEAGICPGNSDTFRGEDIRTITSGDGMCYVEHLVTAAGRKLILETHKVPLEFEPGKVFLLGLCVDISREWKLENEQNAIIETLNGHIRNEQTLNRCLQDISVENDFERSAMTVLRNVGESCGADRCAVFRYSDNRTAVTGTYEWVRDGIERCANLHEQFTVEKLMGLQALIHEHKLVAIEDISHCPELLSELSGCFSETHDLKSLVLCGIWDRELLRGVLALDFVRERHSLSAAEREMLESACNLFVLARERQRRLEELDNSMSLQKQLVDGLAIPLALIDRERHVVIANPAAAETVDLPVEALIGSKCCDSLCKEDGGCPPWCPLPRVLQTGKPEQVEFEQRGRNYRMDCQPIFDSRGDVRYVLEAVIDMTVYYRQKAALEAGRNRLLESNALLKTCIEQDETINSCMELLVFKTDFDSTLERIIEKIGRQLGSDTCAVYWRNEGTEQFVSGGYWSCREEGIPGHLPEIRHEEYPAVLEQLRNGEAVKVDLAADDLSAHSPAQRELAGYLRMRGFNSIICTGIWRKGKYWGHIGAEHVGADRHFDMAGERMLRAAARLIELLIERDRDEKVLERSEYEKMMIFNLLEIPLILFDAECRVVRLNPAAAKMAGKSEAEMLAQPCYRSICGNDTPPAECTVGLTLESGRPQQMVRQLFSRMYQISTLPFFEDGKLVNVLQSFVDITEPLSQQEQLRDAMEKAQAADRAKSAFLATMSHEIRTPLNAVIGFSELLQSPGLDGAEQQEYVRSINFAGNALLRLINDILDLSKIEAEQIRIVEEEIALPALCREIAAIFRHKVMEKKLEFRVECPENLPLLQLDSQRIRQILLNLVGNALKFTERGTVGIEVEFVPESETAGSLTIHVRDTGIGIRPEYQQIIFQPFVQDRTLRDSAVQGTGLGLTISSRLVQKMGGVLSLESTPGEGSCFTVQLKVRYGGSGGEERSECIAAAAPDALDRPVLLVDDVPMNLKVLGAMLKKLNVPYHCCASGREALEAIEKSAPAAVLTDLWMPELDGAELARLLAEDPKTAEIPVFVVTADTCLDLKQRELFRGVLLKPITFDGLREVLSGIRNQR